MLREIKHFLIHLRLHYQLFLLSGGYLLGGLMAGSMDLQQYLLQFLNVHVLLFGGATAYNSYWDRDEGPIGGLRHPPKMTRWMHPVSLGLMGVGWIWSFWIGWVYAGVYLFSLILFWLYSTPHGRWKGDPHKSLVAIALSTGFNSVLLGSLAAGGTVTPALLVAAAGASLVLLSLYPVSQIFQTEEDRKRGDRTFAIAYGISGVKIFFRVSYFSGMILLCGALAVHFPFPALILFMMGSISGLIIQRMIYRLKGTSKEYQTVMKVKAIASFSFVLFLLASLVIRHEWIAFRTLNAFYQ
jgi:4-hydroxybenzoate polyprenyltransferase